MAEEETADIYRRRAARYRKLSTLLADKDLVSWLLSQAEECDRRADEMEPVRHGEP